jgi:hypothetical protein
MVGAIMVSVTYKLIYAECHCAECHYAEYCCAQFLFYKFGHNLQQYL